MQINIPKTSTVSHELPIFTQMAQDSKLPISEVKARFKQEMQEQHQKALDDPSMLPMDADGDTIVDMAVSSLSQKLTHPEDETDEDQEYEDMFNLEPGEQDPSAQQFSIDNMDLGFSDDGMQSLDEISNNMDDFGSSVDGSGVNASDDDLSLDQMEPDADLNEDENGEASEGSAEEDEELNDLF